MFSRNLTVLSSQALACHGPIITILESAHVWREDKDGLLDMPVATEEVR